MALGEESEERLHLVALLLHAVDGVDDDNVKHIECDASFLQRSATLGDEVFFDARK